MGLSRPGFVKRYPALEAPRGAYGKLGEARKAIGYYEQYLAIARGTGDHEGEAEAFVMGMMSLNLDQLGERVEPVAHAKAALRILEKIDSPIAEELRKELAEWRAARQQ
jgi:hypothetical protein